MVMDKNKRTAADDLVDQLVSAEYQAAQEKKEKGKGK